MGKDCPVKTEWTGTEDYTFFYVERMIAGKKIYFFVNIIIPLIHRIW